MDIAIGDGRVTRAREKESPPRLPATGQLTLVDHQASGTLPPDCRTDVPGAIAMRSECLTSEKCPVIVLGRRMFTFH